MTRFDTPHPAGFTQAEELELTAAERMRRQEASDLRDLVRIGDFLAPETHRQGGVDEAASAVREWAEDDVEMIAAAEDMPGISTGTTPPRSFTGPESSLPSPLASGDRKPGTARPTGGRRSCARRVSI